MVVTLFSNYHIINLFREVRHKIEPFYYSALLTLQSSPSQLQYFAFSWTVLSICQNYYPIIKNIYGSFHVGIIENAKLHYCHWNKYKNKTFELDQDIDLGAKENSWILLLNNHFPARCIFSLSWFILEHTLLCSRKTDRSILKLRYRYIGSPKLSSRLHIPAQEKNSPTSPAA